VTLADVLRQTVSESAAGEAIEPMRADAFIVEFALRHTVFAALGEHERQAPDIGIVLSLVPRAVEKKRQPFAGANRRVVTLHRFFPSHIRPGTGKSLYVPNVSTATSSGNRNPVACSISVTAFFW